ncbi:MAG: R2-like ligand-binding oxidase [Thermoanaerobaculia bacterium]|nr:R2-like ligand-binding oxidase [Thermoanaerobaculia bacterium]
MRGDPVFGEAWARAWQEALESNRAYREAAADWEGALVLSVSDGGGSGPAVWADLHHGSCREVRAATLEDRETALYHLAAPQSVWKELFDGSLDPLWALTTGKIELQRGRISDLIPYVQAARELVRSARTVPTDWEAEAAQSRREGAPSRAMEIPDEEEETGAMREEPRSIPGTGDGARFQTTSRRGLDFDLFPMRLWEKAKERGVWNPSEIDFSRDRRQWEELSDLERDALLRLISLFQAGEESVTRELLPLIRVIADQGRLEEEIFLTSFLWEEAKHVEVFRRFFDRVARARGDLSHYHGESYRRIFHRELPEALARLDRDPSPVAQAEAAVTYNMIVEGVLAETGYHAFHEMLAERDLLPGMREAVGLLKSDEARHLAYGVFLLSRLVCQHGDEVWNAVESRLEALLGPALGVVEEAFAAYDEFPFGLERGDFVDYATRQFDRRRRRIERSRTQDLEQILYGS